MCHITNATWTGPWIWDNWFIRTGISAATTIKKRLRIKHVFAFILVGGFFLYGTGMTKSIIAKLLHSENECCKTKKHFVLLSSTRSGSTLLLETLANHPEIQVRPDLLHQHQLPKYVKKNPTKWAIIEYIKEFLDNEGHDDGDVMTGFKVFVEQLWHKRFGIGLHDLLAGLNQPKVIILYRKSLLETYVSTKIALRHGKWFSLRSVDHGSIEVDFTSFVQYCKEEVRLWRDSLQLIEGYQHKMVISYEELCENRTDVIEAIRMFLGLKPFPKTYRVYSAKLNTQTLEKRVSNYKQLVKHMARDNSTSFSLDVASMMYSADM